MHPKLCQAFEEIDAAVFSGDTFEDRENLEVLVDFVERWTRELIEITDLPNPSCAWVRNGCESCKRFSGQRCQPCADYFALTPARAVASASSRLPK